MTTEPSSLLYDLDLVVERILRRFSLAEEELHKPIYRYVDFSTFRKMARTNKSEVDAERGLDLWMMDAETMNDPLEGQFLLECSSGADAQPDVRLLKDLSECARQVRHNTKPLLTFTLSFSREGDDLDLWRHYCNGHGVSLGFLPDPKMRLYKVTYGRQEAQDVLAELVWPLAPIVNTHDQALCSNAFSLLRPVLYLVKADAHQSDKEVRLIETRSLTDKDVYLEKCEGYEAKDRARLYIVKKRLLFSQPSDIAEVILGPLADKFNYLQGANVFLKEVQFRLAQNGAYDVVVTQSRHEFRG